MTKNSQVSIIIAKNSKNPDCEKFLSRCEKSIRENTKIKHEIIVEEGFLYGPAKARNVAVKKTKGEYLFFLDYDTQVAKNWLKDVVVYLDKDTNIGGGQLKLLRMDRKNIFDSAGDKLTPFGFLAERTQEAVDNGQFDKVEPIFSGKGAAMIVRKDVFEKVGGFDPDYFMYWEEPDLAWRIWKAGYRFVFLPMGTVYHAYGTSDKPVSRARQTQITYLGCRNQLMTMIKNAVGWRGAQMVIGVSLGWLGLLMLFGARRDWARMMAVLQALGWIVVRPRWLWRKRIEVVKRLGERFYCDGEWLEEVTDNSRGVEWYRGKAQAYLTGRPF